MFVVKQQYLDKGNSVVKLNESCVMQSAKQCMGPCFKTIENGSYSLIAQSSNQFSKIRDLK